MIHKRLNSTILSVTINFAFAIPRLVMGLLITCQYFQFQISICCQIFNGIISWQIENVLHLNLGQCLLPCFYKLLVTCFEILSSQIQKDWMYPTTLCFSHRYSRKGLIEKFFNAYEFTFTNSIFIYFVNLLLLCSG